MSFLNTKRREQKWLKRMAQLFGVDRTVITKHLGNIFKSGELVKDSVCAIIAHTASDGKKYNTQFYNLDAVLSVGAVTGPKKLGTFGASYLYPMFLRFGVVK